jgi:hypothetical protein
MMRVGWALLLAMITSETRGAEIRINIPRDDNPVAVITFLGEMTVEDIDNFHTKIGGISQAIVVFDSPGGAVLAGIQIGTEIRARQFWTFVKGGIALRFGVCACLARGSSKSD